MAESVPSVALAVPGAQPVHRRPAAVVLEVLEALEPVRSEFVGLVDGLDLDAWLSVHVHQFDETPDGTLSTDVLARLVALRLDLDLDLYLDGPASGEGPGS